MRKHAWLVLGLAFVLTALALRAFVFGVVRVRTGSMEPSVREGEVWVFSRLAEPVVGDVVVLRLPDEPELHVKRVVAVGPAEVELDRGRLYVDGQAVGTEGEPLSWVDGQCRDRTSATMDEQFGAAAWRVLAEGDHAREEVPAGAVWLLGDARRTSHDSRQWGPVPSDAVQGVIRGVAWTGGACEGESARSD